MVFFNGYRSMFVPLKKHRKMILTSIFFFNLGCGITLSLMQIEFTENAASKKAEQSVVSDSLQNVQYAVVILSGPNYKDRRDAIRRTWSKFAMNIVTENEVTLYRWNLGNRNERHQHDLIKFYFVIGAQGLQMFELDQIKTENEKNRDILLLDNFEDSYKRLATKLTMTFKWLNSNLKSLKYVIKCDDDSFLRIDLIIRELDAFAPAMDSPESKQYISYKKALPSYKGLYWGYFDGAAHVRRSGKWQEMEWFLCDNYLPYALGGGYVISSSIVNYIARNADLLSHYYNEDVSMGVWTAALDGINRVHDTRFDTEWKSRGCSPHMLVRHKQTPMDMEQMYEMLVKSQGSTLCLTESSSVKSYLYDWRVLPSKCCKKVKP